VMRTVAVFVAFVLLAFLAEVLGHAVGFFG
jgi:hypothetical protein